MLGIYRDRRDEGYRRTDTFGLHQDGDPMSEAFRGCKTLYHEYAQLESLISVNLLVWKKMTTRMSRLGRRSRNGIISRVPIQRRKV
jgi:hypothetical protein